MYKSTWVPINTETLVPHQESSLMRPFWEFQKLQPLWVFEGCEASWFGSSAISTPGIPLFQRLFFFLLPLMNDCTSWFISLAFLALVFAPLAKREAICMGCWQVLFQAFWGKGDETCDTEGVASGEVHSGLGVFFFENWRVTHQMQPLDRFGDVQWCLTGNRIVGVKWDTLHFHMIHGNEFI